MLGFHHPTTPKEAPLPNDENDDSIVILAAETEGNDDLVIPTDAEGNEAGYTTLAILETDDEECEKVL